MYQGNLPVARQLSVKAILINKTSHSDMSEPELDGDILWLRWGRSRSVCCMFTAQMFPLSLPNDLDIKSCRFPVVNLPRGTSENMHSMALAPALQILTQNIINKHNTIIPKHLQPILVWNCFTFVWFVWISTLLLNQSFKSGMRKRADCFPFHHHNVCITSV